MTTPKDPNTSQMNNLVQQFRSLTNQQKRQLQKETTDGSPLQSVTVVQANAEALLRDLPVLTEPEAYGLLASSEARSRTNKGRLVEKLAAYLDQHYDALAGQIPRINCIVGAYGSAVLDAALQRVNKARRSRGAVEVALLDALQQIHQNQINEDLREGRITAEEALDRPEQLAAGDYQAALEEYLRTIGTGADAAVLGSMSLQDVKYLKEAKRWIETNRPELADPSNSAGGQGRFFSLVARLLEQSRQKGMGPITAQRAAQERAQRRTQPNVLFEPIDGRGGPKWGGVYPNVRTKTTRQSLVPEQGPRRMSAPYRVLTDKGLAKLGLWEKQNRMAYGLEPGAPAEDARGTARDKESQRLMATPEEEGMWRWYSTLESLGFDVVEEEVEVDGPDRYQSGEFGGFDISELIQQMQNFHRSKDAGPDNSANPYHQVP